jgi:hypothetical protein
MELTREQLGYIRYQMNTEGRELRDILLEEYPTAEIFFLIGYDCMDTENPYHIHSVGFDGGVIAKMFDEASGRDGDYENYDALGIASGTIRELETGLVSNPFNETRINGKDRRVIYFHLSDLLTSGAS